MSILDEMIRLSDGSIAVEPAYYAPLRDGDFAASVPLLKEAMRNDDAHAMAVFGTLLAFGRGIESNMQDAADWFRQSAVRGNLHGQAAFGACLATGMGVAIDRGEAAHWLWRAMRGGLGWAAEILSDLILGDQNVVDGHFTMQEFYAAYAQLRRPVAKTQLH